MNFGIVVIYLVYLTVNLLAITVFLYIGLCVANLPRLIPSVVFNITIVIATLTFICMSLYEIDLLLILLLHLFHLIPATFYYYKVACCETDPHT